LVTVLLVILVAVALGLLLAAVLTPRGSRWASPLRFASHRVAQITAAVLIGWVAVVLAQDHLVLGVLLGLLSAGMLLIQAFLVWGFFHFSSSLEEDERSSTSYPSRPEQGQHHQHDGSDYEQRDP
jgi:hypothetical protein